MWSMAKCFFRLANVSNSTISNMEVKVSIKGSRLRMTIVYSFQVSLYHFRTVFMKMPSLGDEKAFVK